MGIWHDEPNLSVSKRFQKQTLLESLGIEITEIGDDYIRGTMPVDHRTVQPYGILHGGASVSLAETLGSIAAHLVVDSSKYYAVGMEVNANHIRPATSGFVTGEARPIHIGKSSQIWSIEIKNKDKKLVCVCRLTMAIVPKTKITDR